MLTVNNLSAGYKERQVLWNISFTIKSGEKVLLMGPNGSGKSTLIKTICGVINPYNGIIIFKGEDITSWNIEKRIKSGISYLRQSRNVFQNLSVIENLQISYLGNDKKKFKEKLEWILSIFPFLKNKLGKRVGLLSGGERQAVAIGMVLMKDADLFLLDEPIAGLSPKAGATILNSIGRVFQYNKNLSLIIIEHNIRFVSQWVDRVLGLSQGKIVIDDKIESILKNHEEIEKIYFGGNQ